MSRGRHPRHAPRIVALGMLGMTAQAIAHRVGCGEEYAATTLREWRAEGGEPLQLQPRRIARQVM